ncbi:hypothetical protein [Mesorhizobium sp.]|uniref:hypothetical protein n=1 Tax=Mesorhizobium sp. TaxID=1871066 RepID=UPI000FE5DFF3|nr:hypothetical protein [Mesorhizobium sp.]RWP35389.1 MAG: hypothetical protein EOR03_13530 [Mesorhizobium sp.]TIL64676.1 MAG: hypothetical protein E5Y77_25250 [Mesorhizobium sp.]
MPIHNNSLLFDAAPDYESHWERFGSDDFAEDPGRWHHRVLAFVLTIRVFGIASRRVRSTLFEPLAR